MHFMPLVRYSLFFITQQRWALSRKFHILTGLRKKTRQLCLLSLSDFDFCIHFTFHVPIVFRKENYLTKKLHDISSFFAIL